jgi:hypothetical protein
VATSITFAVGYRNSDHNFLRRVTDKGTFSPGVEVQHMLPLYNDVTFGGKETRGCKAIAVTWANGTHWSGL